MILSKLRAIKQIIFARGFLVLTRDRSSVEYRTGGYLVAKDLNWMIDRINENCQQQAAVDAVRKLIEKVK